MSTDGTVQAGSSRDRHTESELERESVKERESMKERESSFHVFGRACSIQVDRGQRTM